MNLRRWFSLAVVLLVVLAAAAWLARDLYERVTNRQTASGACDGQPVGTVRIDKNGNPQICLKR